MLKRFIKLLYIFSLIGLAGSFPVYLLTHIQFDEIKFTTYKAVCLDNNQYVILEGASSPYVFDEFTLKNSMSSDLDTTRMLNFYCTYYDQTNKYVVAYQNAKTDDQRVAVNQEFYTFREGVFDNVYSYPERFKLEIVNEIFQLGKIYNPIMEWFMLAIIYFLILQIIKISYTYVVYGEIVFHPFRISNKKQI